MVYALQSRLSSAERFRPTPREGLEADGEVRHAGILAPDLVGRKPLF
jgi:hypothetical protein